MIVVELSKIKEKVFECAYDMWHSEGSYGYCRMILGIYAEISGETIEEVEAMWEKETPGYD